MFLRLCRWYGGFRTWTRKMTNCSRRWGWRRQASNRIRIERFSKKARTAATTRSRLKSGSARSARMIFRSLTSALTIWGARWRDLPTFFTRINFCKISKVISSTRSKCRARKTRTRSKLWFTNSTSRAILCNWRSIISWLWANRSKSKIWVRRMIRV